MPLNYLNGLEVSFIKISSKYNKTQLTETNGSLFMHDLLAVDFVAERFFASNSNFRNSNGSFNINFSSVITDTQAFYLFSHKIIISSLLILRNYLPENFVKQNNFPIGSFEKFYKYINKNKNDFTIIFNETFENRLDWAKNKIIDKRDKMVQHWTTNPQNQLFPMLYLFDLPVATYEHPEKFAGSVDEKRLLYWTQKIVNKYHIQFQNTGVGSELTLCECIYPILDSTEKQVVDSFLNSDLFIALPVNTHIIKELRQFLEKIFELIEKVNSKYNNPQ